MDLFERLVLDMVSITYLGMFPRLLQTLYQDLLLRFFQITSQNISPKALVDVKLLSTLVN